MGIRASNPFCLLTVLPCDEGCPQLIPGRFHPASCLASLQFLPCPWDFSFPGAGHSSSVSGITAKLSFWICELPNETSADTCYLPCSSTGTAAGGCWSSTTGRSKLGTKIGVKCPGHSTQCVELWNWGCWNWGCWNLIKLWLWWSKLPTAITVRN